MDSLLEQQRRYHEERERLVDAMTKELLSARKTQKEVINSDHRVNVLLERHTECTGILSDLYNDKDGMMREEISSMSGSTAEEEFYRRFKSIKEFHKGHPNMLFEPLSVEFEDLANIRENDELQEDMVKFSDEEGFGKFLDLHECYEKFINLKGQEKVDYITYLTKFDHLFDFPREHKKSAYHEYLQSLTDYLADYCHRVKPLLDLSEVSNDIATEFEKHWKDFTFPGWGREQVSAMAQSGVHYDLSACEKPEDLLELGPERLKSALMALGLKCGGTLNERAQRLFSTKGKSLEDIDRSLFAKKMPSQKQAATKFKDYTPKQKEIASFEAKVYRLVELLREQRQATRENVQRKQARGLSELEEEADADLNVEADLLETGDDDVPYNPKNLPLGWDGKPIPYWLYKLHGLNMYFTCEICGKFTYRGPKAFQMHFSEWRHAHGMRCLGIPNTAHFHNVTLIEDALALWERLKSTKESERFQAEADEEYEDSLGNVVSKKTFDDLKRQGLL